MPSYRNQSIDLLCKSIDWLNQLTRFYMMATLAFNELIVYDVKCRQLFSEKVSSYTTNIPCVFHVEKTLKRLFPRLVNVEYLWCVYRVDVWQGLKYTSVLQWRSQEPLKDLTLSINYCKALHLRSLVVFWLHFWTACYFFNNFCWAYVSYFHL